MTDIRFWAITPLGRVVRTVRYNEDEEILGVEEFAEIVDEDLELWVQNFPLDKEVEENYGWTRLRVTA